MAPTADDKDKSSSDTSSPGFVRKAVNLAKNWRSVFGVVARAASNGNVPEGNPEEWSHSKLLAAFKSVSQDNVQLREERDAAVRLSMVDPLTGLSNRAGFEFGMKKTISSFMRSHGKAGHEQESIVVGFFDLDDFKQLNDTQGHAAGDKSLKKFAQRLDQTTRNSDYVARLGGDEFVAGMITDNPEQAQIHLRQFQSTLEKEKAADKTGLSPACSLGFGVLTHGKVDKILEDARMQSGFNGVDVRDLANSVEIVYAAVMSEADAAMYQNKIIRKAANAALTRNTPASPHAPGANAA